MRTRQLYLHTAGGGTQALGQQEMPPFMIRTLQLFCLPQKDLQPPLPNLLCKPTKATFLRGAICRRARPRPRRRGPRRRRYYYYTECTHIEMDDESGPHRGINHTESSAPWHGPT